MTALQGLLFRGEIPRKTLRLAGEILPTEMTTPGERWSYMQHAGDHLFLRINQTPSAGELHEPWGAAKIGPRQGPLFSRSRCRRHSQFAVRRLGATGVSNAEW